jgi:hypothetical protein
MKTEASEFLPTARREGIITKEVDGELLIYDSARDKAHCLNPSAAAIWQRCDGRLTVVEMARSFTESIGAPVGEDVIHFALKQFSDEHLLAEGYEVSRLPAHLSRRTLVRKLGMGVALLPLITSISAPTALAAVSCSGPCSGAPGRGTCPAGCICSDITSTCVVV